MQDLTLRSHVHNGCTVVALHGELDLHTAQTMRAELLEACSGRGGVVLVDLAALRFCDVAGLNLLVDAQHHAASTGKRLALVGPQGAAAKVLRLTELDSAFEILPPLGAAGPEDAGSRPPAAAAERDGHQDALTPAAALSATE